VKISQIIGAFLFWGVSLVLYFFAPDVYSYQYCILIFIVYSISSIWIIRRTLINKNYFNFHLLFLISFFFVNFVYPIFLYTISPAYFSAFIFSFNENVITKATALALIGSSSYILGVSIQSRGKCRPPIQLKRKYKTLQYLLSYLVYFMFIILLYFAGAEMISGRFGSSENIPAGVLVIFQVCIGLSVILIANTKNYKGSIVNFIRNFNKPILALLFFYILLFLYTGDRGPAVQIVLITICAFSLFIRPVKLKTFIIMVLAGMLVLNFITFSRPKNINDSEAGLRNYFSRGVEKYRFDSIFDPGMDLIVCNRNLYVGYDYANKNGLSYGKGMVRFIFAPFPLLPSLMTEALFDKEPKEMGSGKLYTEEAGASWGLGNNMISDQYMEFGLLGVIFFMFLLGYIVRKFQMKATHNHKFVYIIGYIFLVAYSIYLPRATVLEPIRHVTWAIILFYSLKYFSGKLFPPKSTLVKSHN